MNYEKLINTIREIILNDSIEKNNLTLVYELPEKLHRQMNEDIFYRLKDKDDAIIVSNTFEVEIEGILIKFNKKEEEPFTQ